MTEEIHLVLIVGDVIYNEEMSIIIKEALAHASYVVSFKMA